MTPPKRKGTAYSQPTSKSHTANSCFLFVVVAITGVGLLALASLGLAVLTTGRSSTMSTPVLQNKFECNELGEGYAPPGICTGYIGYLSGEHTDQFDADDCLDYFIHHIKGNISVQSGAVQVIFQGTTASNSARVEGIVTLNQPYSFDLVEDIGTLILKSVDGAAENINYTISYSCEY